MAQSPHRLVHLDLKGAPPKVEYLAQLLPLMKSWGCTGLLIEYEDTFPFSERLSTLVNKPVAYSEADLQQLLELCEQLQLFVMPLVQCFGHLEYVLKHEKYFHLRECSQYPNNICPLLEDAYELVRCIIDEVVSLHRKYVSPDRFTHVHIGADEVYFLRRCPSCRASGQSEQQLFLRHVTRVANHVAGQHRLSVVMWDDMLRQLEPQATRELAAVAQPMIWHYANRFQLQPEVFSRLAAAFPTVWFAGAFKGAVGACCQLAPLYHHVENTQAWLQAAADYRAAANGSRLAGFVLTGWQRFDHLAVLCELLPAGVPSLAVCLSVARDGHFTQEGHALLSKELGFQELIPWNPFAKDASTDAQLSFPGWQVYQAVHRHHALKAEFATFLNSDWLQGWLSQYQASRSMSSPAVVERVTAQAEKFATEFASLETAFRDSCRGVLPAASADEWLQQRVAPLRRKCERLLQGGKQIVALAACQSELR